MDEAPRQEVDVAKGIESTLIMLNHKLKHGVTVTRNFDPDLPRIFSYGSELNQVWTNMIDNAADAMQGKGELRIRTMREGEDVLVEFVGQWAGRPRRNPDQDFRSLLHHQADGENGLGLDRYTESCASITENQPGLPPGYTCFRVRLPIHNPRV